MSRYDGYEIHPAAEMMPPLSDEAYARLKNDIMEAGGNQQPIVMYRGAVVAGRHRLRACCELDIEPRFEALADRRDPYEYVASEAATGRSLTASQLAIIAARFAKAKQGRPAKKAHQCAFSLDALANRFGVSKRSIQCARHVLGIGTPETIAQIERQELTVKEAYLALRRQPGQKSKSPPSLPAQEKQTAATKLPLKPVAHDTPPRMSDTIDPSDRRVLEAAELAYQIGRLEDRLVTARDAFASLAESLGLSSDALTKLLATNPT